MRVHELVASVLTATVLLGACTDRRGTPRPQEDPMYLPTPAIVAPATTAAAPTSTTTVAVTLDTTVVADEIVLRIDGPVRRGQPATVSAVTASNATCSIVVASSSGSRVDGLSAKGTDGAGNVSWSWIVAPVASPGAWPLDVDCITVSGIRAIARGVLRVE